MRTDRTGPQREGGTHVSVRLYHTIDTVVRSRVRCLSACINNLVMPTACGSVFVYIIVVFNTTLWTGHVLRGAGSKR
eukprot:COSAG02_NODE_1739_length_11117_cov_14.095843_3_plen_77_part_00